jgi:hypothetical protein
MDPWIAGFASNGEGPEKKDEMVVLFPARTPSYPNSSLEDVLRHEVAHVLIRARVCRAADTTMVQRRAGHVGGTRVAAAG